MLMPRIPEKGCLKGREWHSAEQQRRRTILQLRATRRKPGRITRKCRRRRSVLWVGAQCRFLAVHEVAQIPSNVVSGRGPASRTRSGTHVGELENECMHFKVKKNVKGRYVKPTLGTYTALHASVCTHKTQTQKHLWHESCTPKTLPARRGH